jgi:hypothetical protein
MEEIAAVTDAFAPPGAPLAFHQLRADHHQADLLINRHATHEVEPFPPGTVASLHLD